MGFSSCGGAGPLSTSVFPGIPEGMFGYPSTIRRYRQDRIPGIFSQNVEGSGYEWLGGSENDQSSLPLGQQMPGL